MPRRQRTKPVELDASELPELTPNQMEFVRLLLAGKSSSDAYRGAYTTENMQQNTIWAAASRLRSDAKIDAWLVAGRTAHLGTAVLTKEMHLQELERLRELAMKSGNYGAAVAAEQTRGKVAGHHIERIQEVPADPVETLRTLYREGAKDAAIAMAEQHGIPLAAITEQPTAH
jgi:phage terminase small subunit